MSNTYAHMGGYHGTSFRRAKRILRYGFESNGRSVFFSPLTDEGIERAFRYGRTRAGIEGDDAFSILRVAFTPRQEEYDADGLPQLEIPAQEARFIIIMQFTLEFPTTQQALDITAARAQL